MERESGQRTAGWTGGPRSSVERLPADIQAAVAAAIESGATIDEITASIRARGGNCSRSAVGRHVKRVRGLIRRQRTFDRVFEEWVRVLGPRAEGRAGLIAIETMRTLVLHTLAELSRREEPVSTEELARLSLTLLRIEQADTLRIQREKAMAEAGADAGAAPAWANLTHDEQVQAIRRGVQKRFFPNFSESPPPEFEAAGAPPEDSHHVSKPEASPGSPADGEPDDPRSARGALDPMDSRDAGPGYRAAPAAIGPHDPAFCPWEWRGPG